MPGWTLLLASTLLLCAGAAGVPGIAGAAAAPAPDPLLEANALFRDVLADGAAAWLRRNLPGD